MSDEITTLDDILLALDSSDPGRRRVAAHRTIEFAEAAVDALFSAILRPENLNHRGTLVFALRAFRCENRFSELFDLAINGTFEVQNHALSILNTQAFDVTPEQIRDSVKDLSRLVEREYLSVGEVEALRTELTSVLSRVSAAIE